MCFIVAAVCDFCKKKESELYQKEVGKMLNDLILSYLVFFSQAGVWRLFGESPKLSFTLKEISNFLFSSSGSLLFVILPSGGSSALREIIKLILVHWV